MSNRAVFIAFSGLLYVTGCGSSDAPKSWAGKTYLLEITKDHWSDPPRIGNDIGDFVPSFLLGIESMPGSDIQVTLGTADKTPAQQPCNPTEVVVASEAGYPSVDIEASTFPLFIKHPTQDVQVNATIHDLKMVDVLPNGGTPASEGELTAVMDLRELYPLFTQIANPTPDVVCMALDSFGAPCTVCDFDGASYCLALTAVRLGALEAPDLSVEPIDAGAVDASCADSGS